ncbi:unnamed protein product [Peniophora sp. CBMAI 1063]|nr:unnamed protein product [Peniophora sp. CBMAI 1063]
MTAADPTYPLYPIACLLSAACLLLVLLSSCIRQSWNLGVAFLCLWIFVENVTSCINAIAWSDNADIKLLVYCDIVSRLQLITYVVKPMATLIIARRLYLITCLRPVESSGKAQRNRELALEWTLGLILPVLVAGPLYYIVQEFRFEVIEGVGCGSAQDGSGLCILLVNSWVVVPPLLSVTLYYPRVIRMFYRQKRDHGRFSNSDGSVPRNSHLRVLALASIDILLTLPIGITTIVLDVTNSLAENFLPFYPGWTYDHTEWAPVGISNAEAEAGGTAGMAQQYFGQWTSPVLALAIFALFGFTAEARASYMRAIRVVCGRFGLVSAAPPRTRKAHSTLGTIEFGERPPQDVSFDAEYGIPSRASDCDQLSIARATPEHVDEDKADDYFA